MGLLSAAIVECIREQLPNMVMIAHSNDDEASVVLAQRGSIIGIVDDCMIEDNDKFDEVLAAIKDYAVPIIIVIDNAIWCGTYYGCFDICLDPHGCDFQSTVDDIVRRYRCHVANLVNGV